LATPQELSDFLKSVERRAFKRAVYHVRDDEAALDIVQDSMMKLVEHYSHKEPTELPMLFQRILTNSTLDWFRRQKTRNAIFSNLGDFHSDDSNSSLAVNYDGRIQCTGGNGGWVQGLFPIGLANIFFMVKYP
jgi:RNA polymerase sigma-70 factor (ECF subfamily)